MLVLKIAIAIMLLIFILLLYCCIEVSRDSMEEEMMKATDSTKRSRWVTRLHSNGGEIDSFSHLCPECKCEYLDQNVKGEAVCPVCGADMDAGR